MVVCGWSRKQGLDGAESFTWNILWTWNSKNREIPTPGAVSVWKMAKGEAGAFPSLMVAFQACFGSLFFKRHSPQQLCGCRKHFKKVNV